MNIEYTKHTDALVCRCKDYQLANLYPARAVALGCVSVIMTKRGLRSAKGLAKWVEGISGGKVDMEDFEETVGILSNLGVT